MILKQVTTLLIEKGNFRNYCDLNEEILNSTGLYCFRLRDDARLPERYQRHFELRTNKLIYIGKTEKQCLRERLEQEIEHSKPGTFFRSIGCVLMYYPIKGHLNNKINKNNFKFSEEDTLKISEWLKLNIEISILSFPKSFNVNSIQTDHHFPF